VSGISLLQAFMVTLFYVAITSRVFGIASGNFNFPLVTGLWLGWIMGDPVTGTMLGAVLQTLNMAPSIVGFTVSMDLQLASVIAIPMAMATGMDTETILAFAVPFTVIGTFMQPVCRTANTFAASICDRAAAEANAGKYYFGTLIVPAFINIIFRGIPVFLALYFGQYAMEYILSVIPEWLMIGFIAMGKVLPAVGFGIFLYSLKRKDLLPFFFLGFYIMYFGSGVLSMIGITIFASIIAVLYVQNLIVREGGKP